MKTLILLAISLACGTGIMAWAAWQERRGAWLAWQTAHRERGPIEASRKVSTHWGRKMAERCLAKQRKEDAQ
jgi:hypothetical protein